MKKFFSFVLIIVNLLHYYTNNKIFIDSITSKRQTLVLTKILSAIIGKRSPYLIIDFAPDESKKDKY